MLCGRERRRPGRHSRMQHRTDVSVIGIVTRAKADVEKGRVLRVESFSGEQHMRSASAADSRDVVARPAAPRQARAERCDAQKVEQQEAELAAHIVGECFGIKRCGELGECASWMMLFYLHLSGCSQKTLSSSCPALCRASASYLL